MNRFHQKNVGQYIAHYVNDTQTIEANSFRNFFSLISDIAAIIFSVIALAMYHYVLLAATLILAIVMLKLPQIFSKRLSTATAELSNANGLFSNRITNILNGCNVFFNADKLRMIPQRIAVASKAYATSRVDYTRTQDQVGTGINSISLVCQILVDVITSTLAIMSQVPFGAISSTGSIAASIFNGLKHLSKEQVQLKATEPLVQSFGTTESSTNEQGQTNLNFEHAIVAQNLGYQIEQQNVLTDLNFTIKKNEKVATIGQSGSGESTLLKILSGQLPDYSGSLKVDGREVKELTSGQLRQITQYVDQNNYLFNDSIVNNITIWAENPAVEKVESVLSMAGVDFVSDYDTVILENGRNFSGAQQQRIGLARSFYAPKPIISLDEITSALDTATAKKIEQRILADKNRTVLEVTHHLNPELSGMYSQVISLDKQA
ncbi:ATP-binding cassette domain-containing protein [Amylolactobacillus amylophilus]|uniref:ATP-binding cassette domain-containing protein n=1 Tax=Amylolactobacillus amylophilus TaxID=1603 RepID=UPI0021005172|nr:MULTISPECIES: ABC transporter ATP-binding protein [Amylolactobacillus]